MKVVLQRVKEANVKVKGEVVGKIGKGVVLLIGIERGDGEEGAKYLANKIVNLRIFPDNKGKMNLSLLDVKGEILAVSQFTLAASLKKGRRPSFENAEEPQKAEKLFNFFVKELRDRRVKVETGIFGAMMEVFLINDGPVTYILEYPK
ncbi:D-aminoacyl-tRNA deacylase [SCandidatus Aminicenantes bacterium Aminicenantia_JdfR_composite]|jgi:D-tyrosyl-tRNA(Tyr) deacylase|nr:D-aminoacyl-tRNA deacylase [SCandidatus Aminicenantes bacterium Aminicenantia_JdfR_composite]MCP2598305.1 D-aminoacyl-tRNA deacylase [Candidatus Aminicenantes bacterium AC-335-L06]MCP2620542.1 D-aminoacyl-tRNA deacylase [Candidatus Aminicenantes bacterium AC-334-E05]